MIAIDVGCTVVYDGHLFNSLSYTLSEVYNLYNSRSRWVLFDLIVGMRPTPTTATTSAATPIKPPATSTVVMISLMVFLATLVSSSCTIPTSPAISPVIAILPVLLTGNCWVSDGLTVIHFASEMNWERCGGVLRGARQDRTS